LHFSFAQHKFLFAVNKNDNNHKDSNMDVIHHGAASGVTGSCHELVVTPGASVLVDIGLFQGAETSGPEAVAGKAGGAGSGGGSGDEGNQEIDFPIDHISALVVTHCHIDHVGRLPWLLIAIR